MNTPKLLSQIFSIPLGGDRFLVYAPLKKTAFIANAALVNRVYEVCAAADAGDPPAVPAVTGVVDELLRRGFFVPEPEPPDEYAEAGVRYDTAVLFLTNVCNLRCRYCYAHSGEYPKKIMGYDTAKAAIDFVWNEVRRYKLPAFTLGFHGGGEPTMNFPVLRQSVEYVKRITRDSTMEVSIAGASNGCWSPEARRFILENFTEASISLDGLPEIQNEGRPVADGGGSFELVDRTLRELDDAGFPYGIRMTVTNSSVARLAESIGFICRRYRPRKVQVEPSFAQGRAVESGSMVGDLSLFIDGFIAGYAEAVERGIELFYSGARPDTLTRRFCLAACRALVVTADGDVTTCFESYGREHPLSGRFIVGGFDGRRFAVDEKKLAESYAHTVDQNEHCAACFCKWHCAGDCAIKSLTDGGGTAYRTTERCIINQDITKFLLLEKIARAGGSIWYGDEEAGTTVPAYRECG